MQFSFKYCIDPKYHKSEEEYEAIAVEGQSQSQSFNWMPRTEEYHLNIKTMQLCLCIVPSYHLSYENICKGQKINLRCTLQGCQHLKYNNYKITELWRLNQKKTMFRKYLYQNLILIGLLIQIMMSNLS